MIMILTRVFYGDYYPYIIEFINSINSSAIKTDNLHYLLRLEQFDGEIYTALNDQSFTSGWFYNNYHSSGEFGIQTRSNLYSTYSWNNAAKIVSINDNIHRLTGVRNLVVSQTENNQTDNWTQLNGYYSNGQGYMDKIYNVNVHDYNKNLYQVEDIKGQYIKSRLYYNLEGSRLRFQLVDTNSTISQR